MPTRPPVHQPLHGSLAELRAKRMRDFGRARGSAARRGYDGLWTRFRLAELASRPLCQDCHAKGRVEAASELHHIARVRDAPQLRLVPSNTLALCQRCHATRTGRGE